MAIFSVHLKPSVQLTFMLSFAHSFVACLLWPLTLPISVKLLGSIALVASLAFYLRHYALLKSAESVVSFELSEELQCTLETQGGRNIPCKILGSTFVAPYLVVLILKAQDKFFTYGVVILSDNIDAEEFRRLRVLLRWKWKTTIDKYLVG